MSSASPPRSLSLSSAVAFPTHSRNASVPLDTPRDGRGRAGDDGDVPEEEEGLTGVKGEVEGGKERKEGKGPNALLWCLVALVVLGAQAALLGAAVALLGLWPSELPPALSLPDPVPGPQSTVVGLSTAAAAAAGPGTTDHRPSPTPSPSSPTGPIRLLVWVACHSPVVSVHWQFTRWQRLFRQAAQAQGQGGANATRWPAVPLSIHLLLSSVKPLRAVNEAALPPQLRPDAQSSTSSSSPLTPITEYFRTVSGHVEEEATYEEAASDDPSRLFRASYLHYSLDWELGFPYHHRSAFADLIDEFDHFLYTEDDVLFSLHNLLHHLHTQPTLDSHPALNRCTFNTLRTTRSTRMSSLSHGHTEVELPILQRCEPSHERGDEDRLWFSGFCRYTALGTPYPLETGVEEPLAGVLSLLDRCPTSSDGGPEKADAVADCSAELKRQLQSLYMEDLRTGDDIYRGRHALWLREAEVSGVGREWFTSWDKPHMAAYLLPAHHIRRLLAHPRFTFSGSVSAGLGYNRLFGREQISSLWFTEAGLTSTISLTHFHQQLILHNSAKYINATSPSAFVAFNALGFAPTWEAQRRMWVNAPINLEAVRLSGRTCYPNSLTPAKEGEDMHYGTLNCSALQEVTDGGSERSG